MECKYFQKAEIPLLKHTGCIQRNLYWCQELLGAKILHPPRWPYFSRKITKHFSFLSSCDDISSVPEGVPAAWGKSIASSPAEFDSKLHPHSSRESRSRSFSAQHSPGCLSAPSEDDDPGGRSGSPLPAVGTFPCPQMTRSRYRSIAPQPSPAFSAPIPHQNCRAPLTHFRFPFIEVRWKLCARCWFSASSLARSEFRELFSRKPNYFLLRNETAGVGRSEGTREKKRSGQVLAA